MSWHYRVELQNYLYIYHFGYQAFRINSDKIYILKHNVDCKEIRGLANSRHMGNSNSLLHDDFGQHIVAIMAKTTPVLLY